MIFPWWAGGKEARQNNHFLGMISWIAKISSLKFCPFILSTPNRMCFQPFLVLMNQSESLKLWQKQEVTSFSPKLEKKTAKEKKRCVICLLYSPFSLTRVKVKQRSTLWLPRLWQCVSNLMLLLIGSTSSEKCNLSTLNVTDRKFIQSPFLIGLPFLIVWNLVK